MIDVKSLYPSALGFAGRDKDHCLEILGFEPMYPYGNINVTREYKKDKIGFYECIINYQREDYHNVIPYRCLIEETK